MSIFKLLKFDDVNISGLQSVDEMMLVPLVGTTKSEVAKPQDLIFKSTTDYGTMRFRNDDKQYPAIVPSNLMVRGKDAQDHAMSGSGIVKCNKSISFNNACCVESSQGGYLTDSQDNFYDILPLDLRREFCNDRDLYEKIAYDKIWNPIINWLKGMGIEEAENNSYESHLNFFYNNKEIKNELEAFAAEFEPIENQIGALILFSGVPVGLEIMPTAAHWDYYWKLLIRGCYGAELIRLKRLKRINPVVHNFPDLTDSKSIEEIEEKMEEYIFKIQNNIPQMLDKIDISSKTKIQRSSHLVADFLKLSTGGGGEVIHQNNNPIYLSLVL